MRSLSFSSLIGGALLLAQAMAERHALVEHKALAAPAAVRLRDLLKIFQDAALEMVDLAKSAREQMAARLFAADAAGGEHGDPTVFCRIEFLCRELLELSKA